MWFGLRFHSRRQRSRIGAKPGIRTDPGIERNVQALQGRERSNDSRFITRPNQVAAMIEQHERARRQMFEAHVRQGFGKTAAIYCERWRRIWDRLLSERNRDDRQGQSQKRQPAFWQRPIGQLFHPPKDSR